jgi:hypothetical protein
LLGRQPPAGEGPPSGRAVRGLVTVCDTLQKPRHPASLCLAGSRRLEKARLPGGQSVGSSPYVTRSKSLGILPRFAWPAAAGWRRPAFRAGSPWAGLGGRQAAFGGVFRSRPRTWVKCPAAGLRVWG